MSWLISHRPATSKRRENEREEDDDLVGDIETTTVGHGEDAPDTDPDQEDHATDPQSTDLGAPTDLLMMWMSKAIPILSVVMPFTVKST